MGARDQDWALQRALLAIVSGVLVFLAFPNWNHAFVSWFALVPLLVAAEGTSPWRGFKLGLIAGTVTNFGGFHWITFMLQEFGHLPVPVAWGILLLQAVTQGMAMALGVALWRYLARCGAPSAVSAFAAMWAGEIVTPMIFPWYLGNGITSQTAMIQIADLGGVSLVSAQLYAANAALAELGIAALTRRRPALSFLAVCALLVATSYGYGRVRIEQIEAAQNEAKTLKIGLVEGDVGIWEKEARHLGAEARVRTLRKNLLKHQRMSAKLENMGAELIVWPESAYQPYGAVPVIRTEDRFLAVGAGGALLRHNNRALVTLRKDKRGLPRTTELLTGLSSPSGDIWRYLIAGREVVTSSPWGTSVVPMPDAVQAVDSATAGVNLLGRSPAGVVLGRRGRIWQLAWPEEPLGKERPLPPPARPELVEVPGMSVGEVDMTAVAVNGVGDLLAVGRAGVMLRMLGHSVQRAKSPTTHDLWAVSGDPLGHLFVAAGANGVIVTGSTRTMRVARSGGSDLYAAWFGPDGTPWVAGADGALMRRSAGGTWRPIKPPAKVDLLGGASDALGRVLVLGRGGQVWQRSRVGVWQTLRKGGTELTDVIGFQAQASFVVPRAAKRLLPARSALPRGTLDQAVAADQNTPEFERNTPRRGFATPLLMGAMTHGGELPPRNADCKACYNSALLIDTDGRVLDLYDKAFLLVFGEYMPFGETYPTLYDLLPESSRFQAGTRTRPVTLGAARIGLLICYEDLLPRHARRVAEHNPNVFINMTNDAWFGATAEPYHHMQLAQLRTVEYRRWLIRSTNTGVSVFIDALGRRVKETKLTGAEVLMHTVPLMEQRTVYAALGDWPVLALLVLLLLLWARALRAGESAPTPKKKPRSARASAKNAAGGATSKKSGSAGSTKKASDGAASPSKPRPKKARTAPGKPEVLEPGSLR